MKSVLLFALAATAALGQTPPVPPVAPLAPLDLDLDNVLAGIGPRVEAALAKAGIAMQTRVGIDIGRSRSRDSGDDLYDSATRLLDERRYDDAIARFGRVIVAKTSRADRPQSPGASR